LPPAAFSAQSHQLHIHAAAAGQNATLSDQRAIPGRGATAASPLAGVLRTWDAAPRRSRGGIVMDCVGGISGGSSPAWAAGRPADALVGQSVAQIANSAGGTSRTAQASSSQVAQISSQSVMAATSVQSSASSALSLLGSGSESDSLLRFLIALLLLSLLQQLDSQESGRSNSAWQSTGSFEYLSMTSVQTSFSSYSVQESAYSGEASGGGQGGGGESSIDLTA